MVYGIKFTIGIAGNGLVILVVGYQKTVITTTDKYRLHLSIADLLFVLDAVDTCHSGGFLCMSVHVINLYSSVLILAFVRLDSYLFVEDGVESVGSRAICQCSYPSKSGRRFSTSSTSWWASSYSDWSSSSATVSSPVSPEEPRARC
ncbi:hypothetical protein XENOCAPTIV_019600 [Xenoophorus captivus]|uniref:G-protein coupled receptors family 1 profile domain-containing protein n=1 Tax=Xenoophorus captivus TaxID=1517983 RepID=A0ABV0RRL8_9TELE